MVTHPSTNLYLCCLTSNSLHSIILPLSYWYYHKLSTITSYQLSTNYKEGDSGLLTVQNCYCLEDNKNAIVLTGSKNHFIPEQLIILLLKWNEGEPCCQTTIPPWESNSKWVIWGTLSKKKKSNYKPAIQFSEEKFCMSVGVSEGYEDAHFFMLT